MAFAPSSLILANNFLPLNEALAVQGVYMKMWILFFLSSFSFLGYSNSVNPVLMVMECLRNIPDSEITNPEHTISKELSLMTSVIENITLELGTNTNEQKEFRELYKVAFKHCPKEISLLKAGYKSTANKAIKQD